MGVTLRFQKSKYLPETFCIEEPRRTFFSFSKKAREIRKSYENIESTKATRVALEPMTIEDGFLTLDIGRSHPHYLK